MTPPTLPPKAGAPRDYYSLEQWNTGIAEIQERMLVGAQEVSHAGSGGMVMYAPDVDLKNLPPRSGAVLAFVVNAGVPGYLTGVRGSGWQSRMQARAA